MRFNYGVQSVVDHVLHEGSSGGGGSSLWQISSFDCVCVQTPNTIGPFHIHRSTTAQRAAPGPGHARGRIIRSLWVVAQGHRLRNDEAARRVYYGGGADAADTDVAPSAVSG